MHEGMFRREDRAWNRTAQLGAWSLAPYTKKNAPVPTAYKLLGRALQLWPRRIEAETDDVSVADDGLG